MAGIQPSNVIDHEFLKVRKGQFSSHLATQVGVSTE
jgi:hypothetical protein